MADYEGKSWMEVYPLTKTERLVVKDGSTVYMGNIIQNDAGYADQFDPADAKDIQGVWVSKQTTGDGTTGKHGACATLFSLVNCYIAGVAATDVKKPVWAKGEDAGCNASAAADLSLTYTEGAKALGYVKEYSYANHANVWVEPKPFVRSEFSFGRFAYDVIDTGGAGSTFAEKTFSKDVVVRKLKAFIHTAFTATKGEDIKVNVGLNAVTGTLALRNAMGANAEVEVDLSGDYLFVAAGTSIFLEYDATEGVAADAGEVTFYVEYDEVPTW
jgi:hypothetical protein